MADIQPGNRRHAEFEKAETETISTRGLVDGDEPVSTHGFKQAEGRTFVESGLGQIREALPPSATGTTPSTSSCAAGSCLYSTAFRVTDWP